MKITLKPQAAIVEDCTKITVNGDIITVNGEEFDLSSLPGDSEVQGSAPAVGLIKRIGTEININLVYQYSDTIYDPKQLPTGDDCVFNVESGDVELALIKRVIVEQFETDKDNK